MKYSCEVIKDLLPLYYDDVCSEESKDMVEEHLEECPSCQALLRKMKNTKYDQELRTEKTEVVGEYTRHVKKRSAMIAGAIAAVLAVPILVCLIVNLATGHGLDWFFIVLTSLMVVASFTIVPLTVEKRKYTMTVVAGTGSVLLLLLTCAIYSGGNWFFTAALPVLLGVCIFFLPGILYQLPLKGFLAGNKGLFCMLLNTVLLFAVVFYSIFYSGYGKESLYIAFLDTIFPLAFSWILFLLIRYFPVNGLIKAGICTILTGIVSSFSNDFYQLIHNGEKALTITNANFTMWNTDMVINANVYLIILVSCLIIGIPLFVLGIWRHLHKK